MFPGSIYRSIRLGLNIEFKIPKTWFESIIYDLNTNQTIEFFEKNQLNYYMKSLYTRSSGDFQGMHKNHWFKIRGYIESSVILHLDTWLMLETSGFGYPLIIRIIGSHMHLFHEKEIYTKPGINPKTFIDSGLICNGDYSFKNPSFYRKNWI